MNLHKIMQLFVKTLMRIVKLKELLSVKFCKHGI